MTLILEEELHLANQIRAELPSPFPLLFCGRALSIYLNGDSQAPTVCVHLWSALYHQEPCFTNCGLGFSRRRRRISFLFPKRLWHLKLWSCALLKYRNVFCLLYPTSTSKSLLYDVTMLCSVNTMLPVTLEKPTMFLYITITFSRTPLRTGPSRRVEWN